MQNKCNSVQNFFEDYARTRPSLNPVLRIRIRIRIWIHQILMFLGLLDPDPDPLVRAMDPDPSIIKQK